MHSAFELVRECLGCDKDLKQASKYIGIKSDSLKKAFKFKEKIRT